MLMAEIGCEGQERGQVMGKKAFNLNSLLSVGLDKPHIHVVPVVLGPIEICL